MKIWSNGYGEYSICHDLFVRFFKTFEPSSNNSWILQLMSKEWISFESRYGRSAQDYNQALKTVGMVTFEQASLLEKRKTRKRERMDMDHNEESFKSADSSKRVNLSEDSQPPIPDDNSRKVFVVNLPMTATKHDLEVFFAQCGTVLDVRIGKKNPGIAYVDYEDAESASLACKKLDHMNFRGNLLQVRPSNPPKGNAKLVDGVQINPLRIFVGNLRLGEEDEEMVLSDLKEMFNRVRTLC
jgi:hypothetical protein